MEDQKPNPNSNPPEFTALVSEGEAPKYSDPFIVIFGFGIPLASLLIAWFLS